MEKGKVSMYYGEGKGKTTLAIGQGLRTVAAGKTVIMVQFLDYNQSAEQSVIKMLEPDFKLFKFEKTRHPAEIEDENVKKEIKAEIQNAFNFCKKTLETGECDQLILDGVLDAINKGFISEDEFYNAFKDCKSPTEIIFTGTYKIEKLFEISDSVYSINTIKK